MESARDKLFGDLIKKVLTWQVPTLSLSFLVGLDTLSAIVAFVGAVSPAVPAIVDYFVKRKDVSYGNSIAYLIGLKELGNK
jgi:hypothetical protein